MTIQPPPTPLAVPLPASAAFSESAIRALPSDAYYASPSTGSDSGASKQTPPAWLNDLRTKGYAVVPDLVPQERCDAYVNDALTWLEDFGLGFKRDDKETWHGDKLPVHHVGGLYNRYGELRFRQVLFGGSGGGGQMSRWQEALDAGWGLCR